MSREQERVRRRLEQNPIVECNRIQRKYYPELFSRYTKVKDPRNQSYILRRLCWEPCIINALEGSQACRK